MGVMIDVLGAGKRERVMADTWGHLRAQAGVRYPGFILFAQSEWGETCLLACDFEGLEPNPWHHDNMVAFINNHPLTQERYDGVRIWRWEGTYREFKTGSHAFVGRARPQRLVQRFPGRA